jgi:hypothetical protein
VFLLAQLVALCDQLLVAISAFWRARPKHEGDSKKKCWETVGQPSLERKVVTNDLASAVSFVTTFQGHQSFSYLSRVHLAVEMAPLALIANSR